MTGTDSHNNRKGYASGNLRRLLSQRHHISMHSGIEEEFLTGFFGDRSDQALNGCSVLGSRQRAQSQSRREEILHVIVSLTLYSANAKPEPAPVLPFAQRLALGIYRCRRGDHLVGRRIKT